MQRHFSDVLRYVRPFEIYSILSRKDL